MLGVGGQTLQTVGNQLPKRTDILIFGGQYAHGPGLLLPVPGTIPQSSLRQVGSAAQLGHQFFFSVQRGMDARFNALLVKISVCNGGKQIQGDQMIDLGSDRLAFLTQGSGDSGDSLAHIHQQILHDSYIRLLAAHTHHSAPPAPGGLLTLITKHFVFHLYTPS